MIFGNLGALFDYAKCSQQEKEALIEQLALIRFKKTMELIKKLPQQKQSDQ